MPREGNCPVSNRTGCLGVPILPKQPLKQYVNAGPVSLIRETLLPRQGDFFWQRSGSSSFQVPKDSIPLGLYYRRHTHLPLLLASCPPFCSLLSLLVQKHCGRSWSLFLIPPGSKHCASSFWTEIYSQQRTQRIQGLCKAESRPCVPPTCMTGLCSHAEVAAAALHPIPTRPLTHSLFNNLFWLFFFLPTVIYNDFTYNTPLIMVQHKQ